ncbi:hypothetical protein J1N35_005086 [Gossypium stocksii]|uniref:Uncharacterized protein n=1 Tax=Gossypium stocksii TaxID=47602 RepID=A0A9D4AIX7_9ROSI|nr:hypothetical protein J1N35_005086 [Gossypium stocksii]
MMENGGEDNEEVENENGENAKNLGNERLQNKKWKSNNKLKGLVKCFICDGLHMVKDCLKKSTLSNIEGDD